MHTSGSTGTPKGVALRHTDITAFATDHRFTTGTGQRVLVHSPETFDPSFYELWVTLLGGGTCVIAPPQQLSIADIEQAIIGHQVTQLFITAGLFRTLVEENPTALRTVREVWS